MSRICELYIGLNANYAYIYIYIYESCVGEYTIGRYDINHMGNHMELNEMYHFALGWIVAGAPHRKWVKFVFG